MELPRSRTSAWPRRRGRLEPDPVRGLPRDPELRGPRAGRGPDHDGGPGRRHLRAGSDLLPHADRPPAFQGGHHPSDAGTGQGGRPGAAVAAAPGPAPGCRDDRAEVPAQGPAAALRQCRRPGRGPGPVPGRAGDPGPADRGRGTRMEVEPAPAGGGPALRGGGGGHRPGLRPGFLAVAERGTGTPRRDRETGPTDFKPGVGTL